MSSVKCQIFVRNLPKHTTSKQLQQYGSRFGPIVDAYLTDNDSEGFIEFTDRQSVDVFMNKRPHFLDAIEIQCQRCLPPNELQKPVKRIFLRGPVQQLNESRLSNYFDKYGKVVSCTIPKGKRNNTFTHFGYAFVAFDDEDVVDRIIQDKPHYIEDVELEVEKAEDLTRHRRSRSRSQSTNSPMNNHSKRSRRETPSPPNASMKRVSRPNEEFTIRQLEEENRRLREHALMAKHHFDENMWKLRRELDDERRRYEQLKVDYDYLRRDLARLTGDLQQKSSTRYNNSNSKSSRH
jgi:RNA recognition motif-containing protein